MNETNMNAIANVYAGVTTIDVDKVAKVYSGRPGCGCGCNGKYYTEGPMVAKVTRIVNEAMAEHGAIVQHHPLLRVGMNDGIAYYETDRRYYWVYTNDAYTHANA